MKIRNKLNPNKFGEIVPYDNKGNVGIAVKTDEGIVWYYHSLAELNEEWEDYKEAKEYWYVSCDGRALKATTDEDDYNEKHISGHKEIGNRFETKEEAEKAVEKLKAWKRLKDKGFRFNLNYSTGAATINHKDVIMCWIEAYFDDKWEDENMKSEEDLDLLLGGEE